MCRRLRIGINVNVFLSKYTLTARLFSFRNLPLCFLRAFILLTSLSFVTSHLINEHAGILHRVNALPIPESILGFLFRIVWGFTSVANLARVATCRKPYDIFIAQIPFHFSASSFFAARFFAASSAHRSSLIDWNQHPGRKAQSPNCSMSSACKFSTL